MSVSFVRARRWTGVAALGGTLALSGGCATASSVSVQEEVQMGNQYAAQINRQLPIVQNAAIHRYINQLGSQLARSANTRGIPYRFYVVDSPEINAFAIPGGHIYVNRGLIEAADNVSELAGVLGHEIAHVVERHGVENALKAQNANTGLGLLYGAILGRNPGTVEQLAIQGGGAALFASYGRDAEREADLRGVQIVSQAGINPMGMVTFFNELLNQRQRNPGTLEQWFASHPLTEERIENTRRAIQALPAARSSNLTTNTQEFQQFKARVRQLPPSPRPRQ